MNSCNVRGCRTEKKLRIESVLAGFRKVLVPLSVERPKPGSGAYAGRFGSEF